MPVLGMALLALAAAAAFVQEPPPCDQLDLSLARIRDQMSRGSWRHAQKSVSILFARYGDAECVKQVLPELAATVRECAFRLSYDTPGFSTLVSGRLLSFKRSTGAISIAYEPMEGSLDHSRLTGSQMRDFEVTSTDSPNRRLYIHPIQFVGNYRVRVIGSSKSPDPDVPSVLITPAEGPPYHALPGNTDTDYPPQTIVYPQFSRDGKFVGGSPGMRAPATGMSYDVTIWGTASRLSLSTVSRSDKKFSIRRPASSQLVDGVTIVNDGTVTKIVLDGKSSGRWAASLFDAHEARALEEFNRTYDPKADIPDWATAELASRPTLASAPLEHWSPPWQHVYSFSSAHYSVKSDIGRDECIRSAEALERLYDQYRNFFRRVHTGSATPFKALEPEVDGRLRAFVFSGQSAFERYAKTAWHVRASSSLGVYHRQYKAFLAMYGFTKDDAVITVRHEGLHQFLDHCDIQLPRWLEEGLADYFAAGTEMKRGRWRDGLEHRNHVTAIRSGQVMLRSANDLAAMSQESFYGLDAANPRWAAASNYASAWSAVYWLQAEDPRMLAEFIACCRGGDVDAASIKECEERLVSLIPTSLERYILQQFPERNR